jgi:hypothetical protein
MKFLLLALLTYASSLVVSQPVAGQVLAYDSSASAAISRATQRYSASTQAESGLLNGTAYVNPTPAYVKGHPFFMSDFPQRGTITYDGSYFVRVPLLYEQAQDQVILFDSVRNATIQLVSSKILSFSLGSHRFLRLSPDSASAPSAGFYELLVDGPARLLAKRTKMATKVVSGQSITGEYESGNRFFVQYHQRYYQVTNLKQVLGILPGSRAELQQFARSSGLKFKDNSRETSLTQLLRHYAALAH